MQFIPIVIKQFRAKMQLENRDETRYNKGKFLQFFATACLGPISLGGSLAWTSPVLPYLENKNSTASFHLTNIEGSWVGSMMAIGAFSSALPAGFLADLFGRKKCIIGFAILYIIFAILAIIANDVYVLCVARILSGAATGGVSVVAPMYISEISDPSLRGILGSFFELLIYFGIVKTAVLGAYVHYKILSCVGGIITLILGMVFCFLPESPSYLMNCKKRIAAERALQFYRSNNFSIAEVLDEIENANKINSETHPNIIHAFRSKAAVRGLVACVGLTSFQQLCGVDGIVFYNVQIFQKAGAAFDAYTSSIIVSVVQLLSALLIVLIIEKAARRTFLFISSIGTCACLALLAFYFHLQIYNIDFVGIGTIPLISMIFYNITFAMGLGPIPWIINGEMFGPEIKGIANGITIATNWTLLFIVTKTLPVLLVNIGPHYTFYMYSGFMVLCVIFVKFCVPETRGKTLQEIQDKLSS